MHREMSLKNNDSIKIEKEQLILSGKEKTAKTLGKCHSLGKY